MKTLILILSLSFFSSCASYVKSLHNKIDRESSVKSTPRAQNSFLNQSTDRRPIQNPKTLGGYSNQNPNNDVPPSIKREYGNFRAKAHDLKDNGSDGSLWSGDGNSNFLFSSNDSKRRGDIVIIEVLTKLKDDIQNELQLAFPDRSEKTEPTAEKEPTGPASAETNQSESTVHDKISTQVVDIINEDYLLVRGRKEVLYKKAKRYIELQAVIPQKSINNNNDSITSDKVLEPRIRALRYE